MILLVDGKEVKVLNDVKVIIPLVNPYRNEENCELHITLNEEGMITDLVHDDNLITEGEWKFYTDFEFGV